MSVYTLVVSTTDVHIIRPSGAGGSTVVASGMFAPPAFTADLRRWQGRDRLQIGTEVTAVLLTGAASLAEDAGDLSIVLQQWAHELHSTLEKGG